MPSPPSVVGELPALRTGGGEGRKGGGGGEERGEEGGEGNLQSMHIYIRCEFEYICSGTYMYVVCLNPA